MKSVIRYSIIALLLAATVVSCHKPPEYPVEPSITFDNVYFKHFDDPQVDDTLFVSVNFKDGDGDLGLDDSYVSGDYSALFGRIKPDGNWVTYSDRSNPEYDTLPPYEFPYSCYNYLIDSLITNELDTIYVWQNLNHYNIFVDFYVRKNGQYHYFDWLTEFEPNCGESYYGRFPILNRDEYGHASSKERPLEGKLIYKMKGARLLSIFKNDTIKLDISIQDRAFNRSNTVESYEFVLKDITIN
ncbi:MAG: hypothetical protein KDC79_04095 [Cyclobacteriaceae bacterium]|nr:hypothetical protein [Cyclobacteriaceae bacterium]